MIWLVSILILAAAALFMAWPFFQTGSDVFMPFAEIRGSGRKELREYKARLLLALKELDFDFETGKLSKEDYKALREKYQSEAVQVLKELEEIGENWKKVQSFVSGNLSSNLGATEPSLNTPSSFFERNVFCSSCGKPLASSDRFCGGCGKATQGSKSA